jgi:hypothetical protein
MSKSLVDFNTNQLGTHLIHIDGLREFRSIPVSTVTASGSTLL